MTTAFRRFHFAVHPFAVTTLVALVGCSSSSNGPDAGPTLDASTDAPVDASPPKHDAHDAGPDAPKGHDSGKDGTTPPKESGAGDTGTPDSGPGETGPVDAVSDAAHCHSNADCDPTLEFCEKTSCNAKEGTCVARPGTSSTGFCSPPDAGDTFACGCDGMTYDYDCIAHAGGVNVASEGPCPLPEGGAACGSNPDCGQGLYCKKASCHAATGTCEPMPDELVCFSEDAGTGTCGCDHIDYVNDCDAAANGMNVFAEGQCVLPSGPCTSQDDCGGADYATAVFCDPTTCGHPEGTCTPIPAACTNIDDYVCTCDGHTYENACFAATQSLGIAYGGPCRSGTLTTCTTSADCDGSQVCTPDPRGCDGGTCGVCLDTDGYSCGVTMDGDASITTLCGSVNRPATQDCIATDCDGGTCGTCVYTTSTACDGATPCPTGQLCVPVDPPCGDAGACPSVCVVP